MIEPVSGTPSPTTTVNPKTYDLIVVGGGVVGLSLAWQAAIGGRRVGLLERDRPGRAASWAGAGILPPPPGPRTSDPLDQLHRRARELHPIWAEQLREQTGIDNGYRESGGLYLAHRPGDAAALRAAVMQWQEEGLAPQSLKPEEVLEFEPGLKSAHEAGTISAAVWFRDEAQLRNPHHLQALEAACAASGVEIHVESEVQDLISRTAESQTPGRWEVHTARERFHAAEVCVSAGAWTTLLLQRCSNTRHVKTNVVPIQGQMLLLRFEQPPLTRILNEGPRYLVPRDDGHVLVGSTEEETGFACEPTNDGKTGLWEFATRWLPDLQPTRLINHWAGLRPCSLDGFPYLGSVPDHPGLFVSAGHFRNGLLYSPANAEFMLDLLDGRVPKLDPSAFQLTRGQHQRRTSSGRSSE